MLVLLTKDLKSTLRAPESCSLKMVRIQNDDTLGEQFDIYVISVPKTLTTCRHYLILPP